MLKIITDIQTITALRNQKNKEKIQEVEALTNSINELDKEIEQKKKAYNVSMQEESREAYSEVLLRRAVLQNEKTVIRTIEILDPNFRQPYDSKEVISQIEEVIKELKIESLRKDIEEYQAKYLQSLQALSEASGKLASEVQGLQAIERLVENETMEEVQKYLLKRAPELTTLELQQLSVPNSAASTEAAKHAAFIAGNLSVLTRLNFGASNKY